MYYQGEVDKKERRKIIAVATISVIIILSLIVAIVVVATKKSAKSDISDAQNSAFELIESEDKTEDKTENKTEENKTADKTTENKEAKQESVKEIGDLTTKQNQVSKTTNAAATSADMPNTGPEDVLPIALILGALVTYLSSRALAKREA